MSEDASEDLIERIRRLSGAREARIVERIQSLWSGYGAIWRFQLQGGPAESVVVKEVCPPSAVAHPRGWSSDLSHERKMRSYEIESEFYRTYAPRCDNACRVPLTHYLSRDEGRFLLILEDLDAAGFSERRQILSRAEISDCLRWLAQFHGKFMGEGCADLWKVGTYWQLETRPDEWAVMQDATLKEAARALDKRLNEARFQSLVHGDAKVANFCFAPTSLRTHGEGEQIADSEPSVAAVDFQYVGGGCGMKDVAYFLSSVLDERACSAQAADYLDLYFEFLRQALSETSIDAGAVEAEWRTLYPVAWADFLRFLDGWAPHHYKVHGYSKKMTALALNQL